MTAFDPRKISMEELVKLRLEAAAELERSLYVPGRRDDQQVQIRQAARYSEPFTAACLAVDYTTLKRWRRDGRVTYVSEGAKGVVYLGRHICDMWLLGRNANLAPNSDGPGPA